ncbi:MAG TPA: hypothetical protein VJZ26_07045, partial [Blastocatellia bacterium]|nr:hypothetical protein [Blastocatellia bacterium]
IISSQEGQEFLKTFGKAIQFFPFLFPVGLQMKVNTTECGFITTPCYSARIAGPRVKKVTEATIKELQDTDGGAGGGDATARRFQFNFIVDGLVQIVEPKPNEFTATVLLMGQLLLPTQVDGVEGGKNFAETVSRASAGGAGRMNLPANIEVLLRKIIRIFFSDWQLEWMGVEG